MLFVYVIFLQLEDTAVRVILWDATKSKKTIFRGEVSRAEVRAEVKFEISSLDTTGCYLV